LIHFYKRNYRLYNEINAIMHSAICTCD